MPDPRGIRAIITYINAVKAGDQYFLGPECSQGHSGLRYTNHVNCVYCTRETNKEHYKHRKAKRDAPEYNPLLTGKW